MADEPQFNSRPDGWVGRWPADRFYREADDPDVTRLTYLADDGTTITIIVPWAEVDIIPPPSIPFVDSITKRKIVYSYEASHVE